MTTDELPNHPLYRIKSSKSFLPLDGCDINVRPRPTEKNMTHMHSILTIQDSWFESKPPISRMQTAIKYS